MHSSFRRLLVASPSLFVLVYACSGDGGQEVSSTSAGADLGTAGTQPIGTNAGSAAITQGDEADGASVANSSANDGSGGSSAGPVGGTLTLFGSDTSSDDDAGAPNPDDQDGVGGMPSDGDFEGTSSAGQPASAGFGGMPSDGELASAGAGGIAADWPEDVPQELEACELKQGYMRDPDSCVAVYECDDSRRLEIDCDGENDGTDTSLCSCWKNGERIDAVDDGLYPTETFPACVAAAARCVVE